MSKKTTKNDERAFSYDEIPYPSNPFPQTQPDRMATIALLFGLTPKPINECSVLEIGCASGGNLIPMAEQLPNSSFVGFDLSGVQIAAGQKFVERACLENIELKHMNILDVDARLGKFDYIICHGIFSWVPDHVQTKILEICSENLAANGVAYVSYNTYPGWHMRGMIRDMMCYHTSRFAEPQTRIQQARSLLDFLAQNVGQESAYGMLLKSELGILSSCTDSYLFHEHLEEFNSPLYFYQFIERAAARGLQYLGEAEISHMWTGHLAPDVASTLERVASDLVQMEQYMDFVRNRTFRQTLLCHQGLPVDREMSPESLQSFYVASPLTPLDATANVRSAEPMRFQYDRSGAQLTSNSPLMKAAMMCLGEAWPESLSFQRLASSACARAHAEPVVSAQRLAEETHYLGKSLLEFYVSGMVELHSQPSSFTTRVGERPVASRVARLQLESGNQVTNLRHVSGALSELSCHVLRSLDGTRDRSAVLEMLMKLVEANVFVIPENDQPLGTREQVTDRLSKAFDQTLRDLASSALLIG